MGEDVFLESLLDLQDSLFNFALFLTSNRDDAFDLTQDTTLKALDNRHKYSDDVNLRGWLFTIMHNIFINNYRRSVRSLSLSDIAERVSDPAMEVVYGVEYPENTYTNTEVADVIAMFPEDFSEPFTMHISGYKYEEIAQRLDLPLGTVKSRIFFIRRRLQQIFEVYR